MKTNHHPIKGNIMGSTKFAMPQNRPNFIKTFGYFFSGHALSWGVEVFDEEKVKEQALQEATNVGLLTALLVTITASPLLGDEPSYLKDHTDSINAYFLFFFMSTILLAAGTLSAVLQMIIFASLTGAQLREFHERAGVLMHLPFLFCVSGTLTLAAGVMFCMFHAFPTTGWWAVGMAGTAVVMMIFLGSVVWFCQLLWEFHDRVRKTAARDLEGGYTPAALPAASTTTLAAHSGDPSHGITSPGMAFQVQPYTYPHPNLNLNQNPGPGGSGYNMPVPATAVIPAPGPPSSHAHWQYTQNMCQ